MRLPRYTHCQRFLEHPVELAHSVECRCLFGIGAAPGQAHWGTIREIILAWVITLPLAALLAVVSPRLMSAAVFLPL